MEHAPGAPGYLARGPALHGALRRGQQLPGDVGPLTWHTPGAKIVQIQFRAFQCKNNTVE